MEQPMRLIFVCLVVFFAALAQAEELPPLDESFGRGVLVIDAEDACHRFHIYLALTRDQQRRGLMFVRELAPNAGMLFVYREPAYLSMWMKNTFIPLDMLFVRADGAVASIAEHTEPQSERSIAADELVRYVLELNAGTSARLGIVPGSRLYLDADEYLSE
jgi:uncharacterized membrane protein (UPF0127 family)